MLNIEIYIDTCEDQSPSASLSGEAELCEAERLQQSVKLGEKHPVLRFFSAWRASSEDRQLRITELSDGR